MYDLELEQLIAKIKEENVKRVLIQLPDGLKPRAKEVCDKIEAETTAVPMIWFSSCFGACDIPMGLQQIGIDLFVQFGHNEFRKEWNE